MYCVVLNKKQEFEDSLPVNFCKKFYYIYSTPSYPFNKSFSKLIQPLLLRIV